MLLQLPSKLKDRVSLIENVQKVAMSYYAKNDTAHSFDHALRVTQLSLTIGQREGGDLELLTLAGLLHDTARYEQEQTGICHAKRGAENAGLILSQFDYPIDQIQIIQAMIRTHRFRDQQRPATLEAKILYDADKLDAIGAIGIARSYAICGKWNQQLYSDWPSPIPEENSSEYSPVIEFHFKLKKIVNKMLTPTGQAMAKKRHHYMINYFEQLEAEVLGKI